MKRENIRNHFKEFLERHKKLFEKQNQNKKYFDRIELFK